jgi:hypothetical protein
LLACGCERGSSPPRPRTACRSSPRHRGLRGGARPHDRRTSLRERTTTSLHGRMTLRPEWSARARAAGRGWLAAAVARPRASAGRATSGGRWGPRATASGAPRAAGGAGTASPAAHGQPAPAHVVAVFFLFFAKILCRVSTDVVNVFFSKNSLPSVSLTHDKPFAECPTKSTQQRWLC